MQKGQLTLFAIVGIVLIIVFSFLFFAVQTVSKSQLEKQAEENLNQLLQSSAINFFVTQCVENALSEGLKVVGAQGGKLYRDQGGSYASDFIPLISGSKQENVSYGIKRDATICASTPPEYPCTPDNEICANEANLGDPAFCAFAYPNDEFYRYSINQLPPLCKSAAECGYEARSCPAGSMACAARSIQGQLEAFVNNKTSECVQIEKLAAFNGTSKLTKGNISANISIGDTSVIAVVNFPIIAQFQNLPSVSKLTQFSSTSQIRLKQMYQFADDLSKQNTEKLDFSILMSAGKSSFANSQFSITKFENARNFDDIYRINDTARALSGQNYYFQFAVQNRYPVLNYLGGTLTARRPINTPCGDYDIIAIEGGKLEINPEAFDTDDDSLPIEYLGWRQEYNETFWEKKSDIKFDSDGCPILPAPKIEQASSGRWTDSQEYLDTGWNATILLIEKDIGPHEFIVNVSDGEFSDWQRIRVLIQDLFSVSAGAKPIYPSLGCTNCISIEDPILFEGKIEQIFNPGGYSYRWTDKISQTLLGATKDLTLPAIEFDITDIKQLLPQMFQTADQTRAINFTVNQGGRESSDEFNVNIFECLPHRNANSPPYPYNKTDPFLSDHSCCSSAGTPGTLGSGWGELLGNSVDCFTASTFGSFLSFEDEKYGQNIPVKWYDYSGTEITGFTGDAGNDIFEREFVRSCDGKRGNTCEGPMKEERKAVTECADTIGGGARCAGPAEEYFDTNSETDAKPSCINYQQKTFEQLVGLSNSNLCNSIAKCTAAGDGSQYATSGSNFLCKATCGNGACNFATACKDCKSAEQTCSDTDTQSTKYTQQGTVSGSDSTGCSNAACTKTQYSQQDSCQNTNILIEYGCPTNPSAQDLPYTITNYNCGNIDTAATGDADDSPGSVGTCVDGDIGTCPTPTTGACTKNTAHQAFQEGCTGNSPGNYVYVEYVGTNVNGAGSNEKCTPKNYDPDISQSACGSCSGLTWAASGDVNFGGYTARGSLGCCGDDSNEHIVAAKCCPSNKNSLDSNGNCI